MRVALISPLFESVPPRMYGGTERVVHNLCCGLTKAGIDVTVFASADSNIPGRLISVTNEALRLRNPPAIDPNIYNFTMLSEVYRRSDEFDVIHNNHDYWMLPLTEMTRTPVLTTVHGRLDNSDLATMLHGFPRAQFVSISDSQRLPIPDLKWIRTIHHGIDLSKFRFNRNPGKYLAFLGRIHPEKKPEWAIEISKLSGVPLKIAAKIEGKEGREYFDAFVKPHVDGRFIEFIGEIHEHEKSDFLGNALALSFPVNWPEPFGLVVIESLACGTPVLARPCGSVAELLSDGVTGFLHTNIKTLARKVTDLPRISRHACREWAEQHFSQERMTEDYIDVYRFLSEFPARKTGT